MASQRIKGQEIEILLIVAGQAQTTITDIRSFEVAFQTEILREGYLGETTDRRDEVFRGIRGRLELHFENQDIFTLFAHIIDRARRREAGTRITIKATLNFPNGDTPRVIIGDAFFGEIPISFAGRSEYGTVGLEFEASDARVIQA